MTENINKSVDNLKWLLVYTKANQELTAKRNLENQNFEVFLPLISKNHENLKNKYKAVFPRYLFLCIDPSKDNWLSINSTQGVQNLVSFGQELSTVSNEIILKLKSKVDKNNIFHPKKTVSEYISGEQIKIKEGRFKGLDAIFLSKSGEERSKLLIKFLSRELIADIASSDIGKKEITEIFKL